MSDYTRCSTCGEWAETWDEQDGCPNCGMPVVLAKCAAADVGVKRSQKQKWKMSNGMTGTSVSRQTFFVCQFCKAPGFFNYSNHLDYCQWGHVCPTCGEWRWPTKEEYERDNPGWKVYP